MSQCLPDTVQLGVGGSASEARLPVPLMKVMREKMTLQYNTIQIWQKCLLKRCAGDQGAFVCYAVLSVKAHCSFPQELAGVPVPGTSQNAHGQIWQQAGSSLFTLGAFSPVLCNYCSGDRNAKLAWTKHSW